MSNEDFKAISFKRSEVRHFIKANTELYEKSIKVRANDGSEAMATALGENIVCKGSENLDWE